MPAGLISIVFILIHLIKQTQVTGLFLYPRKYMKGQRFSDVFRGYRKRTVTLNELKDHTFMVAAICFCVNFFKWCWWKTCKGNDPNLNDKIQ